MAYEELFLHFTAFCSYQLTQLMYTQQTTWIFIVVFSITGTSGGSTNVNLTSGWPTSGSNNTSGSNSTLITANDFQLNDIIFYGKVNGTYLAVIYITICYLVSAWLSVRLSVHASVHLYENDYSSMIDIYFYETFSTSSQNLLAFALNSLDTLSDIYSSLLIKTLSIPNPSLACLVLLLLL